MKKLGFALLILVLVGLVAFWMLITPSMLPASAMAAGYKTNLANGQTMFDIGGCAACHMTSGQKERLVLGGGRGVPTAFGTFYAPNISPDPVHGIGGWSELEFANAILRGVGHNGEHLYPVLPYTSYQRMKVQDVRDLFAYLKTLPKSTATSRPHQVTFPFSIRPLLGVWKLLYLDQKPFSPNPSKPASWNRGAYLVVGPGHCAECHSPRDAIGGIIPNRRFTGGRDQEGRGWVPNIRFHTDTSAGWKQADMAEFLKSGMLPDFDSVGGSMTEVIQNTSRLSDADRSAMAEFLISLPPRSKTLSK